MTAADRLRSALAVTAAAAMVALTASACAEESKELVPTVGYGIDNVVTSYNANTVDGAASGARQAFARVQPGFAYTGPEGTSVADTDIGTADLLVGEPSTITYRINPAAVYSDGVALTCDDLVLTWAAHSGRFSSDDGEPLFDAATTAGYADIERVECVPGGKEAIAVFAPGRTPVDWKSLFAATTILPSHVVARHAEVDTVVEAVNAADGTEALAKIAQFWNTGWDLAPGELDLTLFPSAGPYRIESYSIDGGLVLVANERWWGNRPETEHIVVYTKEQDLVRLVSSGEIEVLDVATGSVPGIDVARWEQDGLVVNDVTSPGVDQLFLGSSGVFEDAASRRAFAACVPRQALFDAFGPMPHGAISADIVDARFVTPDELIYESVAGAGVGRYRQPDQVAAAGAGALTVRIGYLTPDERRGEMVKMIARSCEPYGITVEDAGSGDFAVSTLSEGTVDAVLTGTAAANGSSGATERTGAMFALRSGEGANLGGFANRRIDEIVDTLAVDATPSTVLQLASEAENLLWMQMPTLPLFQQPRTIAVAGGMSAVEANPNRTGTGWNMDRWVLLR